MTCQMGFVQEVPWNCMLEIFGSVRDGSAKPAEVAQRAAWVLGCVIESLRSADVVVPATKQFLTVEDLCAAAEDEILRAEAKPSVSGPDDPLVTAMGPRAIPPEVWSIIIQVLLKLIEKWGASRQTIDGVTALAL